MPIVTRVRLVRAPGGGHDHLAGLCTAEGVYFSRYDVATAIDAGEEWWSELDGVRARIRKVPACPFPGCPTPYLVADQGLTRTTELELLPGC